MIKEQVQDYKITSSDEYKAYIKALCRMASQYVSRIRVQYAEKAYEMYQNETVRRIVQEYGKEIEKLDADRLWDFEHVARYGACTPESMSDTCLNHASAYAATVRMLFEID